MHFIILFCLCLFCLCVTMHISFIFIFKNILYEHDTSHYFDRSVFLLFQMFYCKFTCSQLNSIILSSFLLLVLVWLVLLTCSSFMTAGWIRWSGINVFWVCGLYTPYLLYKQFYSIIFPVIKLIYNYMILYISIYYICI